MHNSFVRTIASIAIAVYAPEFIGSTDLFGGALFDYANVIAGGLSGLVASGGDLRAAITGALTAGAFGVAGDITDTFGNIAAHAAIGCASSVAGGGKCGSGALSGGFSDVAAPFASSFGGFGGALVSAVVGGTASVIGGGKFENGAMTGAFGYLFNCLAHQCLSQKWDTSADGYHSYSDQTGILCNLSDSGCLPAVQHELLCNSAPGQSACAIVGKEVGSTLTLGNSITQYAPTNNMIINGTNPDHVFNDGYVVRAISIDSNNNVSIYTYGSGVNTSATMAVANTVAGILIFRNIGVQNQVNVRKKLNQ